MTSLQRDENNLSDMFFSLTVGRLYGKYQCRVRRVTWDEWAVLNDLSCSFSPEHLWRRKFCNISYLLFPCTREIFF